METTQQEEERVHGYQPLVFQIRSLRQWHGDDGLSQHQLSELTSIYEKRLRELEASRELPEIIRDLLAIAIALRTTVEELVNPDIIADIHAHVEKQRIEMAAEKRHKTAAPPGNLACRDV